MLNYNILEFYMKYYIHGHYEPMETALKRAGLKVVYAEKHGKKIVITVTRYEAGKEGILIAVRSW